MPKKCDWLYLTGEDNDSFYPCEEPADWQNVEFPQITRCYNHGPQIYPNGYVLIPLPEDPSVGF